MCNSFLIGMENEISAMFQNRSYLAAYALDDAECKKNCRHHDQKITEHFKKNLDYYYQDFLRHLELNIAYKFKHLRLFSNGLNTPFLKDRNLLWLPKILEYNQKQNVDLFAFGRNHLLGEYGILNLLLERDFTIKQADNFGFFKTCKETLAYIKRSS